MALLSRVILAMRLPNQHDAAYKRKQHHTCSNGESETGGSADLGNGTLYRHVKRVVSKEAGSKNQHHA